MTKKKTKPPISRREAAQPQVSRVTTPCVCARTAYDETERFEIADPPTVASLLSIPAFSSNQQGPSIMDWYDVADQAKRWSEDPHLPQGIRKIATHLTNLAIMLLEERNGCASEYAAAEAIFHTLNEEVRRRKDSPLELFLRFPERRKSPRFFPTEAPRHRATESKPAPPGGIGS